MNTPCQENPEAHEATCLCRVCEKKRNVECILTPNGPDHPDHRVERCPSLVPPRLGSLALCRTCRRDIVWEVVEEPGYLPRTGWSDRARRDALICFRAHDYRHVPTHTDWDTPAPSTRYSGTAGSKVDAALGGGE